MPKHTDPATSAQRREKILRSWERTATFGLLLIAVALLMPIVNLTDPTALQVYKWIYSAGALVFVVARVAGSRNPGDSLRMRRLRRMEFWGGVAFVLAAAIWFYNEAHLGEYAGALAILQPVIMLSMAGAIIQVISAWMISSRQRKESNQSDKGK